MFCENINTMRILLYITVMFTLLLVACSGGADKVAKEKMEIAHTLVTQNPDSAMRILEEIDKQGLGRDNLAHYALLYTIAQDKSGLDVDDDSLLRFAHEYYSVNMSDSMYARYAYYMGKFYMLKDSVKIAHDMLRTSADVAKERNEYYTACLALGMLSNSLSHIDPQVAIGYAKEIVDIHQDHPTNIRNHVLAILDIGECFVFMENRDSALIYMHQALDLAMSFGDSVSASSACQNIATTYSLYYEADSALVYALKMKEYSPQLSASQKLILGCALYESGNMSEAKTLLEEIVANPNSKNKYTAYQLLSHIAMSQDDIENLYACMDSANRAIEDKYLGALATNADYYEDNLAQELENERIKSQSELRSWIMGGGIVILVLLLILSYFIYQNRKNRAERMMELEKERSRMQAEFTEKEHQKQMEQKDRFISMIQRHLLEKSNIIVKLSNKDRKNINTVSLSDWDEMEKLLDDTDNRFTSRLKEAYPDIKDDDFRFCMLVRVNLSNAELAEIYNVEQVSIKKRKQRMKKNIFGIEDSSVSLNSFIELF